ncbi:SIR2 family protein [Mycobacterium sp. 050128]|uniref:SIR2 family protein n=1 Tax=Mycobacterium sp. 050128 TaxID=3096112 RepID=UPI002ED7DD5C
MPTKDRKIELLNKQIEAANDGHPEDIAEWRFRTETLLRRTVGEGSPALTAFRSISFSWISWGDPIDQTQARQRDAVMRAVMCLKSAVAELELQEGMSKDRKIELLNQQIEAANDGRPDDLAEWRMRTETVLRYTVGEGSLALTKFRDISYGRITFDNEDPADIQRDGVLKAIGYLRSAIEEVDLLDDEPPSRPAIEQLGRSMVYRTFADLVMDLDKRRGLAEKPPVLLLGAGASLQAGVGAMPELYKFFNCKDFEEFAEYIDTLSESERYRYLAKFLQNESFPDDITAGYQALATLLANKYFDLVLTTNGDPLLDDALSAARLWRRDYIVLVNGLIRPERMELPLREPSPRVKIVKLHGDLFSRLMAWTVDEMDRFLSESWDILEEAVAGRDFLVIGYSLRDEKVLELVKSAGGSVWFLHHEKVPDHLKNIHKEIEYFRAVVDSKCRFEEFFPALAEALGEAVPTKPLEAAKLELSSVVIVDAGAQTIDDLTSATFGIAGPDGVLKASAFLLEEPRVILCDRSASDLHIDDGNAILIDSNGNSFSTREIAVNSNSPFGPTVLEAPGHLRAPGLRLATGRLQLGAAVQMLVAAGAVTGISSGRVTALDASIRIAEIGEVGGLVELDGFVAPGASGAPVVDETLSVCGFVVATNADPEVPRSFAYPPEHWASFVRRSAPGRSTSGE